MSGIQLHGGLSHDSHVTRCDGRTTRAVSGGRGVRGEVVVGE